MVSSSSDFEATGRNRSFTGRRHSVLSGTDRFQTFTGMEGRLISVGFQSGSADEALNQLSVKYREKAVDLISEAISIVEPTIVIILSLLVGLVLLSVMRPLLGILSDIAL